MCFLKINSRADFSKAFDYLAHELIIVKVKSSYGFSFSAHKLSSNYLINRKQRNKISRLYNCWQGIPIKVREGFSGQFNIYKNVFKDLYSIFLSDFITCHKSVI